MACNEGTVVFGAKDCVAAIGDNMGDLAAISGVRSAFHGPWNGLPSTSRRSSAGRRANHAGRAISLLRRMERTLRDVRHASSGGSVAEADISARKEGG